MKTKRILLLLIPMILLLLLFVIFKPLNNQTADQAKYEDVSAKKEIIIKNEDDKNEGCLIDPTRICVDSKENIFILESSEKCVKKYSKSGSYTGKFGRSGDGPGELQLCYSMEIDRNDNIILYDEGRKKIIRFNNDGKFVNEINLPFFLENYRPGTSDEWYIEKEKDYAVSDDAGKLNVLSLYSSDLKKLKELDSCVVKDMKRIAKQHISIQYPFYSKMIWNISGNDIWVLFTENYNVKIYSDEGKFIKSFTGEAEKTRVTENDKKSFFGKLRFTSSEAQSPIYNVPDWLVNATEFPVYKPLISDILSDSEGHLLIKTANEFNQKSVWDLYTQDGTFVKKILTPLEVTEQNSFLRGGYMYVMVKGKNEIFSVERFPVTGK